MITWKPVAIFAGAVVLVWIALHFIHSKGGDTAAGLHADTVLLEDPAFRDSLAAQEKRLRAYMDTTKRVRMERDKWKDSAKTTLAGLDSSQQELDTSRVTTEVRLEQQQKITADLRYRVIPSLQRVITLDSVTIQRQDMTIAQLIYAGRRKDERIDTLTTALRDLRDATKPGPSLKLPLIGLRIKPRDVLSAALGYCIGGGKPC